MTDQLAFECSVCGAQPGEPCINLRAHGRKPLKRPHVARGLASRPGQFLGVREAARRLSIHPNTIRNMVADGRLVDARVPGTPFIRIDARQIEALEASRARYEPGRGSGDLTS